MCKKFSLVFVFVCCKVCLVHSTPLLITTQIQSQAQIDAIQHSVDQKQGVPRHLLGALEATESHVVDVENPYLVTEVQSVPLMLLKSIDFDNATEAWTLKYDTMALDSSVPQQINQYDRVLYFTNGQNVVPSSDANNNCLLPGTDRASCLKHLRENYILLGPSNSSLAEQTLEMTVTLTLTLAAFDDAAQQAYIESVAETSEVNAEDVTITSITENDGAGRRLLSTTIDVVTDIKIKSERVDDVLTNKLTLDNLILKLEAKGRHYSPQFKKPPKKRLPPKLRPPVVVETPAPPPVEVLDESYNNQRHLLQTTESSADEIEYVAETHNLDSCLTCAIDAKLFVTAGQARQELVLTIPHEVIRKQLAHTVTVTSELYGTTPRLEFGVGMMFLPYVDSNAGFSESPNNVLIFDKFTILENTFKQLAVSKQTSYSIATHIAFWTAAAEVDTSIRVATVEYLLDYGHILQGDDSITASLNEGSLTAGGNMRAISETDCSEMQVKIDTLESKTCLAKYDLCKPFIYTEGSGNTLQTWATIIFPIPDWHVDGTPYQFNTLIRTNLTTANNNQGMAAISTLNFVTNHAPRIACRGTHTQSFDATQHVLAELYRGHDLVFEKIDGLFTIHNTTALSMAESLMTLVLRPDDTTAALDYFTTYDDEKLRLDELYMSHAKLSSTIPSSISNQVHGLPDGRVELVLDSALLQQCPLYDNTLSVGLCTTTKDWDRSGGITRPQGVVYYVHQVNLDDTNTGATSADISWLQNNIFGSSDPDAVIAFRDAVLSKPFFTSDAQTRRAHASVYWIWPVFTWPNTPPIGLVDKTVVSLAWSIAPYA